jgi:hypothetical protein
MEEVPITGLEELERHIQQLVEAPEIPLDAKLLDEVELQLTGELFTRSGHVSARKCSCGICRIRASEKQTSCLA